MIVILLLLLLLLPLLKLQHSANRTDSTATYGWKSITQQINQSHLIHSVVSAKLALAFIIYKGAMQTK